MNDFNVKEHRHNVQRRCETERTAMSFNNVKIAVIYHKDCVDGFGGAWAVSKRLPDAVYIPLRYGENPPDLQDFQQLYIIDFSFNREVMIRLHEEMGVENVILLDHHVTAQDTLRGVSNCHIDLGRSGAALAWQFFFRGAEVPTLLRYVEDRDLWRWALPNSRAVSAYIASWFGDRTFARWDSMAREVETRFDTVVSEGNAILRANKQLIEQVCNYAHTVTLDGYDVMAVPSGVLQSEIGEHLLELYPDTPFVGIYVKDKECTRWSLRSRDGGHNVAQTARNLGGGGHPSAAGFTTKS